MEADEPGEALHAALRARAALAALLAVPEADAQYERVAEAYERAAPEERGDVDRTDMLLRGAELAFSVGDTACSLTLTEAVISAIDETEEPERLAVALRMYAWMTWVADPGPAWEAFERAIGLLLVRPADGELAGVVAQQASCLSLRGRYEEARKYGERALELARNRRAISRPMPFRHSASATRAWATSSAASSSDGNRSPSPRTSVTPTISVAPTATCAMCS